MTQAEKAAQAVRIERKLNNLGLCTSTEALIQSERLLRVISRVTHFQETGEQRRTKKSREEIDAQVVANIGEALRVLK